MFSSINITEAFVIAIVIFIFEQLQIKKIR